MDIATTIKQPVQVSTHIPVEDYGILLSDAGITYTESDYYLCVGDKGTAPFIPFSISLVQTDALRGLQRLIPYLKEKQFYFQVVKDRAALKSMQSGQYGYENIGRTLVLHIPIHVNIDIPTIIDELSQLTATLRGPAVRNEVQAGPIMYCAKETGKFLNLPDPDPYDTQFNGNKQYKLLDMLTNNAKGNVIKAMRYKGFLPMGFCIIKEGRKHMWSDPAGKDIKDRLLWQRDVHNKLRRHINVPKIIDYFEYKGNSYLVIGFVDGKAIGHIVKAVYKNRSWLSLSVKEKLKLLDLLLKAIDTVIAMHRQRIVHRDLTPINFMQTRAGDMYLIDFELCYDLNLRYPSVPFTRGTDGFISPQQRAEETPTIQEDIYAIGALMIFFFTGINPIKFNTINIQRLANQLLFFIGNHEVIQVIGRAVDHDPAKRPSLDAIRNAVVGYRQHIKKNGDENIQVDMPTKEALDSLVAQAYHGLVKPEMFSKEQLFYVKAADDKRVGMVDVYIPGTGLSTGITGILLLLSTAAFADYCPIEVKQKFAKVIDRWGDKFLQNLDQQPGGLIYGTAGLGLALACLHRLGWKDYLNAELMDTLFTPEVNQINIYNGIAGQGLALLEIGNHIPELAKPDLLSKFTTKIISYQKPDGSWPIYRDAEMKTHDLSLGNGIAGILLYLIRYQQAFPDPTVQQPIQDGMRWFTAQAKYKDGRAEWPLWYADTYIENVVFGTAGVAWFLIEAYKITGHAEYQMLAEATLHAIDPQPVWNDLSLDMGLAGLGIVYTLAANVFKDHRWMERAAWLANIMVNTVYEDEPAYWLINNKSEPDPSLLSGNGGVIAFLSYFNNLQIKEVNKNA